MKKILVVVDMQNDFVTGALKNDMALEIVDYVKYEVDRAEANKDIIIFTMDTHDENYMDTEEGKNLPVPHCIENTDGWQIVDKLRPYANRGIVITKETFGSVELGEIVRKHCDFERIEKIEFMGICTDICVLSNVALTKAFVPNVPIVVNAKCCAGVTEESHDTALNAMKAIQVKIEHEGHERWR